MAIVKQMTSLLVRRSAVPVLAMVAAVATIVAVLLSPVVLTWINDQYRYDWPQLSTVGQTYGVSSAILAGLALLGIGASLYLQAGEAKAAREQALRALHADLLRMAIDEPEFLACWGPIGDSPDIDWTRKHIYTNLIVSHWQLMWEVSVLSEAHLKVLTAQFFKGSVGRRFWSEARGPRLEAETSRRARQFTRLVDAQYLAALAAGPAQDAIKLPEVRQPDNARSPYPVSDRSAVLPIAVLAAAAGGVLVGRWLGRSK